MLPSRSLHAPADSRDELVIAPHHPDRLSRPAPRPGAIAEERVQQALTWNVFRTLELITPAFWLRRMHLRLTGEALSPAPQIARVSLWRPLSPPPAQRLDGARPTLVVDVVIETESAMWTLLVAGRDPMNDAQDEAVARLVDAGAWLAGRRDHHSGLIEPAGSPAGRILRSRYARSTQSAGLRSASRVTSAPAPASFGALSWTDLAAVLHDCAQAATLPAIERTIAAHAVRWLDDVGLPASLS